MLNEKIVYYRKKNMLTQEELAEKLNVSRQTITKWEGGMIYPGLEYLIDLSNIFGVTIDFLVKDDDCLTDMQEVFDEDELKDFIIKAKKSTYASKQNKVPSIKKASHDYAYKEGEYEYYDTYFGSSSFSGQEVVYKGDNACWSMNYYGHTESQYFSGDFLKEALLEVDKKHLFRGKEIYTKGDYTYTCHTVGSIALFEGKEQIYYQNEKIYECMYHGGILV